MYHHLLIRSMQRCAKPQQQGANLTAGLSHDGLAAIATLRQLLLRI
jgi:hypothetical protein